MFFGMLGWQLDGKMTEQLGWLNVIDQCVSILYLHSVKPQSCIPIKFRFEKHALRTHWMCLRSRFRTQLLSSALCFGSDAHSTPDARSAESIRLDSAIQMNRIMMQHWQLANFIYGQFSDSQIRFQFNDNLAPSDSEMD